MKRLLGTARALMLVLTGLGLTSRASAQDLSRLVAEAKPSVVHLSILDRSGDAKGDATGFVVGRQGLIVTNYHVAKAAHGMLATRADGSKMAVKGVLASEPAADLAIVAADGDDWQPLDFGSSTDVSEGTAIIVIGNPLGLSWTISEGIVSAIRPEGLPKELRATQEESGPVLQITAPISPGSSGSPVLNANGEVIGVARSGVLGGGNLNFATPVEALSQLMAQIPATAEPQPFSRLPWKNLIISLVFFAIIGLMVLISSRFRRQKVPMGHR